MKNTKIKKPIFILGHNRSGKSVLSEQFTEFTNISYFEHYSNKLHNHPELFPLIPSLFKYRKLRFGKMKSRPSEGLVWKKFGPNWEYLTEKDVTKKIQNYYYSAIKYQLKAFDTNRFINEHPSHCLRIRWLNEMFPDALYIVTKRNPKEIVLSLREKILYRTKNFSEKHVPWYDNPKKFESGNILQDCIDFYNYVEDFLKKDVKLIQKRIVFVDFKNLINNTKTELEKLYKFTNIQVDNSLIDKIPNKINIENSIKFENISDKDKKLLDIAFTEKYSQRDDDL